MEARHPDTGLNGSIKEAWKADSENYGNGFTGIKAKVFYRPPKAAMVLLVTAEWRYTVYRDQDWGELYDLKGDVQETENLWDSEQHQGIRAELAERLIHHLIAQMDESPQADRIA